MIVLKEINSLRDYIKDLKATDKSIAFVPTMGHLHQAHLNLVKLAQEKADSVIVSIYVNPLQFGENEDLDSYPRTLNDDLEKLSLLGVNSVFTPDDNSIYSEGKHSSTKVIVPKLGEEHCGRSRPQFFPGITTVVTKLFNLIQPDVAVFGEKDFQQLAIIRKMVADLFLPVKIVSLPITREQDGLAMSSRNSYLSPEEREKAPLLFQTIKKAKQDVEQGVALDQIKLAAIAKLQNAGFETDYFNICDAESIEPVKTPTDQLVILAAAKLGKTRLIDNIAFSLPVTTN